MADICDIQKIKNRFIHYKRSVMAATGKKQAAVLLLLTQCPSGCSVILTKRMRSLEHHGGEVSFPGGMREQTDLCLRETALRETYEEIGLPAERIKILGILDDRLSRWGHRVTPFVGMTDDNDFTVQKSEVDRIYHVPLKHFTDPSVYWTEKWFRGDAIRTVHFYKYSNDIIWGLTAHIINSFVSRFVI